MKQRLEIEYDGVITSLNDYKSLHWRKLKPIYDRVKENFIWLVRAQRPDPMAWIEVRVYHNTKYDLDNLTGVVKPLVDVLRAEGVIKDDTKSYWDYLSIQYAPQLKKGQLKFIINGEIISDGSGGNRTNTDDDPRAGKARKKRPHGMEKAGRRGKIGKL